MVTPPAGRCVATLLLVAIGVYVAGVSRLAIVSSVAGESSAPATSGESRIERRVTADVLPLYAVGLQLQRTDWLEEYNAAIDEIADLGANAVKLVVDARQENGRSTMIYLDLRRTPSAETLAAIIRYAKSRGLRVIVMPIVLLDAPTADEWRGSLAPASWSAWFESYRQMLHHFAWVAEGAGADVLVIGSELVTAERHRREWERTIRSVRGTFGGLLTYSANWDHFAGIEFWRDLDLVGMNSYWSLGGDANVSDGDLDAAWAKVQKDVLRFVRQTGRPLLLTEVGWPSMSNAARDPWDYTADEPVDLDLQARLYAAFLRNWQDVPELGGFSVWEWPPDAGGPDDRGYTPKNKPAEKVLRLWLDGRATRP